MFEDISSATFYRGLMPRIPSNSKVFLTEKVEGMDGKGGVERGVIMKVLRNIFKVMMPQSKAYFQLALPCTLNWFKCTFLKKCVLHIMYLLRQKVSKGYLY